MLLSKSCVYAIRAALLVSYKQGQRSEERKYIPIREIADELGLSFHFLTKILQILTEKGIMNSFRGPNGGVVMARAADQIPLLDIITAIDGTELFTECALGLPGCGQRTPCPLHDTWASNRASLKQMFETATLASLASQVERLRLRV